MQNLSLRERLAMTAVAAALLLVTVGGWVLRSRSAAAVGGVPVASQKQEAAGDTLEVAAQGDGGASVSPSPSSSGSAGPPPETPDQLVVFVTGAVRRPGVYTLRPGDRLYHAVRAAGGFKPNARQDALNLADAVRDADQVCIPTKTAVTATVRPAPAPRREIRLPDRAPAVPAAALPSFVRRGTPYATILKPSGDGASGRVLGVAPAPVLGAVPSPAPPPADGGAPTGQAPADTAPAADAPKAEGAAKFKNPGDGTVDLNAATLADLQRLPGVGPSTAQRILDYRQQIGRFTDAKQLMDVKGIGEKKFAKMQPFLRLD